MTQPGTDQHQRRVAIGEAAYYSRPSAYFPVQPLNHIVRPDPRPMLAWKIAVGQCLLYAVLNLLGRLFQLHGSQFRHYGFGLFSGCLFILLRMDRLEHFCHQLRLGFWHNGKYIAIEMYHAALVFSLREYFAHSFQRPETLAPDEEFHAV